MPSATDINGSEQRQLPFASTKTTLPSRHPLDSLNAQEIEFVREVIVKARNRALLLFRAIFAEEPLKVNLIPYLDAERAGKLSSVTTPPRRAHVQYDVIHADKSHDYMESVVDLGLGREVEHRVVDKKHQAALTMDEFKDFNEACVKSPLFQEAISKFKLPEGFEVAIDPWPYGGPDPDEVFPRYTQGLCFAKDARNGNPDSNHYGYPLPLIPVMDTYKSEIVRIDKLATGGKEDGLAYGTHPPNAVDHCRPSEYVPELLDGPLRTDLKPLNVIQPEGPSFSVSDDGLVEWQKWRFRVGFNPREGCTLHDVHYDGRSVLYRLSMSEMTVPYGDPRGPFHRKQAFDIGDAGVGRAANNLGLGCDCLGVIRYLDAVMVDSEGRPSVSKNVVCIHEQDNGIGWKHTNFRTNRAVVTRARELVVQFIITLANYEYIFAYKFDQAAGITIETRATGIVSVVNIDAGKTSNYGNVVSPGALAQNHQHIFAVRIDPAVDGHANTVYREESLPMSMNPTTNPHGNAYQVVSTPITTATAFDASPFTNMVVKIANPHVRNPISGKAVAYKLTPAPTQLMLADPASIAAQRAQFARHHIWVTAYRDGELWAGGEFTNQSQREIGGVADAVARADPVEDTDCVVWAVFGLTHNPRVEDWPVMPIERHELILRPADFFTRNPALDVPSNRNLASVEVGRSAATAGSCCHQTTSTNGTADSDPEASGAVQASAEAHWQGSGTVPVANGHP